MRTEFTQADGSEVQVRIDGDYDRFDPWHSRVDVVGRLDGTAPDGSRMRTFHVAPRGNYDPFIADDLESEAHHRLKHQDGEFLVAASRVKWRTHGIAVWRGPFHEVQAYVCNSDALEVTPALARFAEIDFTDQASGLVMTPSQRSDDEVAVRESFTYFPRLGRLDVFSVEQGLGMVPSWEGARVPVGEVWASSTIENDAPDHLVVASSEAVAVFVPEQVKPEFIERGIELVESISRLTCTRRQA